MKIWGPGTDSERDIWKIESFWGCSAKTKAVFTLSYSYISRDPFQTEFV